MTEEVKKELPQTRIDPKFIQDAQVLMGIAIKHIGKKNISIEALEGTINEVALLMQTSFEMTKKKNQDSSDKPSNEVAQNG